MAVLALSVTYHESADFGFNNGPFLLHLLDSNAVGAGFDAATFQMFLNGNLLDSESFATVALAQAFF
jgi:hypothetical protein